MPHQEKSIFSWHTYTDHLRDMLKEMMASNDFADVTLVCDDKKEIKAHRNILSACSPVFKNMLKIDQQSNHPVIYLRGIQHLEMESILKFVYLGETSIHQDSLTEFIQTAKLLEIREFDKSVEESRGLDQMIDNRLDDISIIDETSVQDENVRNIPNGRKIGNQNKAGIRGANYFRPKNIHDKTNMYCNVCDLTLASRVLFLRHCSTVHNIKFKGKGQQPLDVSQESVILGDTATPNTEQGYRRMPVHCKFCGIKFSNLSNMERHQRQNCKTVEKDQIEGKEFKCHVEGCDMQFSKLGYFKKHMIAVHGFVDYDDEVQDKIVNEVQDIVKNMTYTA